jgi:arylsulfatase A-like enzyme
VDDAIGKVMHAIEVSGDKENTIIMFSSDNGPQGSWGGNAYPDDLKLTDFNQPFPMRGKKWMFGKAEFTFLVLSLGQEKFNLKQSQNKSILLIGYQH